MIPMIKPEILFVTEEINETTLVNCNCHISHHLIPILHFVPKKKKKKRKMDTNSSLG